MQPGRELDLLIATEVMGWKVLSHWDGEGTIKHLIDENQCEVRPPDIKPYSTDIAAAWEVVEKLGSSITIRGPSLKPLFGKYWRADFNDWEFGWVYADSAPHAICLAALMHCNALPDDLIDPA